MSESMNRPLVGLIAVLSIMALNIFLIQIIWNEVIVKKFPNANIQKLNFWESLALAVFVALLSGTSIISMT